MADVDWTNIVVFMTILCVIVAAILMVLHGDDEGYYPKKHHARGHNPAPVPSLPPPVIGVSVVPQGTKIGGGTVSSTPLWFIVDPETCSSSATNGIITQGGNALNSSTLCSKLSSTQPTFAYLPITCSSSSSTVITMCPPGTSPTSTQYLSTPLCETVSSTASCVTCYVCS